jgi:nifR3 family TIM-barrel protein
MKIIPAPMAGWTDFAFRQVLYECGAKEVWTEMISATALYMNSEKTKRMLRLVDGEVRQVVQLFGSNPRHFGIVIQSGLLSGYDEININMGCPAPKIVKNGCGCKHMLDIDKAKEIILECKAAIRTKQKLSIKMRLGWDKNVAVRFAKMCEGSGADRIIVHGRLGVDGYRGSVNYDAIAEVVKSVAIPVVTNGNIIDRETANRCIDITKADGIMIGRALLGNPWKIRLDGITPTKEEIKKIIQRHIKLFDGNPNALIKQLLCYCKALGTPKNVDEIKKMIYK